jgi:predicted DNA-binding transcriptional regulator YafY
MQEFIQNGEMALNKYAAIRYRIIDQCIRSRSKPFPSKENLRQACEEALYGSSSGGNISLSTIEKDIWALKNESALGYAPIQFNRLEGGYFYSDPEFSINLPLTQEDVELIRLALHTLSHFRNSQIFKDLENAINKIQDRITLADQLTGLNLGQAIQFESTTISSGQEHLPALLDAIREYHTVEFDYTPYTDGRPRHYRYHPYLLKENKNLWYLVGKDTELNKIRTLGLDRISGLQVSEEHFLMDEEFDPERFFKHSFGIGTYSGVPEIIELLADPVQAGYILANPLHSSQQAIKEPDGSYRIRIEVIPSDELKMQILGYGHRVVISKPDWLRAQIQESLRKAYNLYSKTLLDGNQAGFGIS